jgi:hypothetical protein
VKIFDFPLAKNRSRPYPLRMSNTNQRPANKRAGRGFPEASFSGFFIVNRYDRPGEEHIAERRSNGYLYYVHPSIRNDKRYWAMNPDDPTPLEDFGIHILIEGGELRGKLVDPSRATYLDGRARKWQGSEEFSFDYRNTRGSIPRHPPTSLTTKHPFGKSENE